MRIFLRTHLPGYDDIRKGNVGTGSVQFISFATLLGLLLSFHGTVSISLESLLLHAWLTVAAFDHLARIFQPEVIQFWVASIVVTIGPILLWRFTYKKARRPARTSEHELSEWSIAWRRFKKQKIAVAALVTVGIMYAILLVTPFVAPYHPNAFQDGMVTHLQPPLSRILVLHLKEPRQKALEIPMRLRGEPHARSINRILAINTRLLDPGISCRLFVDAFHIEGAVVVATQAKEFLTVPISQLVDADPAHFATHQFHLLGTDSYGRDLLSRIIYGSRVSLTLGLLAVLLSVGMGSFIGLCAGYFGKFIDTLSMRTVDVLLAFPSLFLILITIAIFEHIPVPRILLVVLVLALTTWMGVARLVRGEVLSLKEREFVIAGKAMGLGHMRILMRHILPNTLTPIIVNATLRIGGIILVEAALSYLNLGVQQPTASWGNIIFEGKDYLSTAWWISTFPGLAIVLTVVCFNLVGDGLRDAFDPMLKDS